MTPRKANLQVETLEDRLTPASGPSLKSLAALLPTPPARHGPAVHHAQHAPQAHQRAALVGVQVNDGGHHGGGTSGGTGSGQGGGSSASGNGQSSGITLPNGKKVDLPWLPKGFKILDILPTDPNLALPKPPFDGQLLPLPEPPLLPDGAIADGSAPFM